ncbi:hypothetical protein HMPREF1597_01398, partial [Escherichia coli 907701]
ITTDYLQQCPPDYAVSDINPTILAAETAFYLALKRDFFTF